MFTKPLLFMFCTIGLFSLLFGLIPGEFFFASYQASLGVSPVISEKFSVANVTVFSNSGSDNMTYTYSSLDNHPSAPQFSTGATDEYFEVIWSLDGVIINGVIYSSYKTMQFRRVVTYWWGRDWENLAVYNRNNEQVGYEGPYVKGPNKESIILSDTLLEAYDDDAEGAVLYARGRVDASIIIGYNESAYSSIVNAWNNDELDYVLSYQPNFTVTDINQWGILAQLLTFQTPNLGIEGTPGVVFNFIVALPFGILIAILIIKLIQSVIPTIRGIDD